MAALDRKTLAALIGAPAAAALIALTGGAEGERTEPYRDKLAGNIWTVCYGDTHVQLRKYSSAECKDLLATRLVDYATPVRDMTPGFDELTDGQKVAAIDFAYNAGVKNYQGSTLRKMYIAQDFPAACNQYLQWKYVKPKGEKIDCSLSENQKLCGGIWLRRQAERRICRGE